MTDFAVGVLVGAALWAVLSAVGTPMTLILGIFVVGCVWAWVLAAAPDEAVR
jgi:hypothetical protein